MRQNILIDKALGMAYNRVASFPVGYVDYLDMHSLDFEEFLWAISEGMENDDSHIILRTAKGGLYEALVAEKRITLPVYMAMWL